MEILPPQIQLKPLDRVRWCCCTNNRTAAFIVAGIELGWLVALAIVVIWRWAITDRTVEEARQQELAALSSNNRVPSDGMAVLISNRKDAAGRDADDDYVEWVKSWFRAITAVMFVAFVAGMTSNICLIVGLKQMRIKFIDIWLVVTAFLMPLVVLFFLLPLIFGGRPNYSAFFEFLIDSWFFVIVLGAREDVKLAVYESAQQMRYQPNMSSSGVMPQTPPPHGGASTGSGNDFNMQQATSREGDSTWHNIPITPNNTTVTAPPATLPVRHFTSYDDVSDVNGISSSAQQTNTMSNFPAYEPNHQHRLQNGAAQFNFADANANRIQMATTNNSATMPSYPVGVVPVPANSSIGNVFQRIKGKLTRR